MTRGDRLGLGEVSAADGWSSRVDDQDDDEIEIDVRRSGGDVLDLEVEVDDGRREVQVRADDARRRGRRHGRPGGGEERSPSGPLG